MIHPDWSDEELVHRLRQHDSDARETLVARYARPLSDWIHKVLDGVGMAQDVEACVNELFVAVGQEIGTFDETRGTLKRWLTMRAKYIALSRRRQLFRKQTPGENENNGNDGKIIDP